MKEDGIMYYQKSKRVIMYSSSSDITTRRHTDPGTTFDANLRKFVEETRAKGGIPVLFNSIVRRNFGKSGADAVADAIKQDDIRSGIDPKAPKEIIEEGAKLIDTHGAYLNSPANVAKELNVTFIDLNSLTHKLVGAT